MEVSALKYSGGLGLHGRSPLLRLQSDERLVALVRRGNSVAFEVLVSRYSSRLLAFCRHLLGSREDAEDVLQEVLAAAFNAMLADEREINVRPWLYRIARNRCLNHLRRIQAVGVDSMDVHLSDFGATTADKVHDRETFRLLVGDISELPETQKTALVLREMDALSYDQIAEAMETTVPSVKSLLVRARISLAEAAEARLLSCDEVRIELGEVAEGLRRRPTPLVRRHLRACKRCEAFRVQLKETNKALTALLPIGPLVVLKKLAITHIGHSAGSGAASSGAAGSSAAGAGAAAGGTIMAGSTAGGFLSAGVGAIATKAAAGLAAAALVTAGAVEVDHSSGGSRPAAHHLASAQPLAVLPAPHPARPAPARPVLVRHTVLAPAPAPAKHASPKPKKVAPAKKAPAATTAAATTPKPATTTTTTAQAPAPPPVPPGRTQTQHDATVLPPTNSASPPRTTTAAPTSTTTTTSTTPSSTTPTNAAGTPSTTP
jgi:RNA polymerase sigma factor (sigma-70 family)